MKIGIISDSHDRIDNLNKAIDIIEKKGATQLIHCGDLSAPFMLDELKKFKGSVHIILGNIADRINTPKKAEELGINYYEDQGEIVLDKKKIAFNHIPNLARKLTESGDFDIVFYGHTHKKNKEQIGKTILVNPGEIMGRLGKPSFAIYNTRTNDVEFFQVS